MSTNPGTHATGDVCRESFVHDPERQTAPLVGDEPSEPYKRGLIGNGFGNKTLRNWPKSVRRRRTGETREAC
jgi:hypothetical protein